MAFVMSATLRFRRRSRVITAGAIFGRSHSPGGTDCFLAPSVDLEGVNTTQLTGGPTVVFNGGLPYIDRVELGVIRTGTNALAGLTPDPAYHIDPFICLTNYGYYAEWNPSAGVFNNVDAGYP